MAVSFREILLSVMSRKTTFALIAFLLLTCFNSCKQVAKPPKVHCKRYATLPISYAKGFAVDYYNGFKVVTLKNPKNADVVVAQYLLKPAKSPMPIGSEQMIPIDYPAKKIVCISTTHIAALTELGIMDSIAAVTNPQFIYNTSLRKKIDEGLIQKVGRDNMPDYEKIVSLSPTFVMTYGNAEGNSSADTKLESMNQKVVMNFDYMEQHPLARAEWIKFAAVFFNIEDVADSLFNKVESEYRGLTDSIKQITATTIQPTVFCNTPFKGIWYMPCGENYMCKLIADAGGNFVWADASSTNGLNLSLDYEAVFSKAHDADVWLLNSSTLTMADLKNIDARNSDFKAYKSNKVYNYDLLRSKEGGIDFWESGVFHPEKILNDLASIFYPTYFNPTPSYYRKIQ
jgi:iron complex transport system substrate-binding protein